MSYLKQLTIVCIVICLLIDMSSADENDREPHIICSLPLKPAYPSGPICTAHLERWYFNMKTCQCETFIYSGCGGNANIFISKDECEEQCVGADKAYCNPCELPIISGGPNKWCFANFRRWGYNTTSEICEEFTYGGCEGNANRFDTESECEDFCPCGGNFHTFCKYPAIVGPCRARLLRYFFNAKTCMCQKFTYSGCGGNCNNFKTLEECEEGCPWGYTSCDEDEHKCYRPKDPGPCKAKIPRYYYDTLTCKCRLFYFGGCLGNANNFETSKKCKTSCQKNTTCPVCNLPKDPGPCKASFERFYFNLQTCKCEKFIYGGCKGNRNNYETIEECNDVCSSLKCPVCSLPSSSGSGRKKLIRWYFDAPNCTCKVFKYGGKKGNYNRFLTKEDCEGSCKTYCS